MHCITRAACPVQTLLQISVPVVSEHILLLADVPTLSKHIHHVHTTGRRSTLNSYYLAPRGLANRMTYSKAYLNLDELSYDFFLRLLGLFIEIQLPNVVLLV